MLEFQFHGHLKPASMQMTARTHGQLLGTYLKMQQIAPGTISYLSVPLATENTEIPVLQTLNLWS